MKRVAYFCMEYGLDPELPLYAGGLGILAGDCLKAAGELRLPLLGIGLLWDEGYTRQTIDADGKPHDEYPKIPRDRFEKLAHEVTVQVMDRDVRCASFRVVHESGCELVLLEPIEAEDKWITRRLYGGGSEDRIAQEILLGIGGVRLLRAMGHDVDVYHFNEGHAVFAAHELLREQMEAGKSFSDARASVKNAVAFTTHTPVAAGNETHPLELLRKMGASLSLTDEQLTALGGSPYSMTASALRLCRQANAVAERHGETAREMWSHVEDGASILSITNGVHVASWQDARIRAATAPGKPPTQQRSEIWAAHRRMKAELLADIKERTGVPLAENGLLVGFARRAATYKRAHLIFHDEERIGRLLDTKRLQLVFSGKAHPRDAEGKALVEKLVAASKRWPGAVIFLENYDMTIGAKLTRGCDVWLNNPVPPLEASGTSGMKAAMNGVLNLSVADGWWPEGCDHDRNGWRIGDDRPEALSDDEAMARDASLVYDLLENKVLPRFESGQDGWAHMMLASVEMAQWKFSAARMLEDYFRLMYQ